MTKRQRKIKSMNNYKEALIEISLLWGASIDSPDGQRLIKLTKMIDEFEEKKFPEFIKLNKGKDEKKTY
ncbi:MAG: hypothetical protein WC516_04570 [Patescibacteria group bacterium]